MELKRVDTQDENTVKRRLKRWPGLTPPWEATTLDIHSKKWLTQNPMLQLHSHYLFLTIYGNNVLSTQTKPITPTKAALVTESHAWTTPCPNLRANLLKSEQQK